MRKKGLLKDMKLKALHTYNFLISLTGFGSNLGLNIAGAYFKRRNSGATANRQIL